MSEKLKYKIGRKVRVKSFENKPRHWNEHMIDWMGKTVTIRDASKYNYYPYTIRENDYGYYESDFSSIVDFLEDDLFEI